MKAMNIIINVLSTLAMALFFVSTIFISEILSYKRFGYAIIYICITAFLYGICIISDKRKVSLLKCGVSFIFFYPVIQYFWKTDYAIRALNWMFPEYGKQSAGGYFSGMLLLNIQIIIYLICAIVGISIKIDDYNRIKVLQIFIAIFFPIVISVIVISLEQKFPQMSDIFYG